MISFRCVVVAAVSDKHQVKGADGQDLESIPSQIRTARELIERRGWREVAEPLIVPGQSRSLNWFHEALEQIGAYRQLRELVEQRRIDLVVCRHYDRLARTSALQQQVSAYLKEHGTQIYSIQMPVEPHDPATWRPRADSTRVWVEAVAGAQSESYINSLVNNHRMGMEGRIRRGQPPDGIPVYGYRDIVADDGYGKSHRKRVPNPTEFPVLQQMLRMLRDGATLMHVARWLNGEVENPGNARQPIPTREGCRWTPATVSALAHNPFVCGKVAYYRHKLTREGVRQRKKATEPGMLVDGIHEAAISYEEWLSIQRQMEERAARAPRLRRFDYLWSGLAVCGYCRDRNERYAMRRYFDRQHNLDGSVRVYDYLICSRYSYSRGAICQRNCLQTADFTDKVVTWLQSLIADPDLLDLAQQADDPRDLVSAELARVQRGLAGLTEEEARWDDAYRAKVLTIERYAKGLDDLQKKGEGLRREEEVLLSRLGSLADQSMRQLRRRAVLERLVNEELTPDNSSIVTVTHELLERIEIRDGSLRFILA